MSSSWHRRRRRRRRRSPLPLWLWVGLFLLLPVPWVVGRPLPQRPDSALPSGLAEPRADLYRNFDAAAALRTAYYLAEAIGPRPAGSAAETQAAHYLAARLQAYGYAVTFQSFRIHPQNRRSFNVIGRRRQPPKPYRLVLGAHMDSVPYGPCPGANDNASGVAVVLELARLLAETELPYTLEIVFFGAEEYQGAYSLQGSTAYVHQHAAALPQAMICLDMTGRGEQLYLHFADANAQPLAQAFSSTAQRIGLRCRTRLNRFGSDHAPFAAAGVPAIWLQRLPDPDNHTPRDRPEHLERAALKETGRLVARVLLTLTPPIRRRPLAPASFSEKCPQVFAPPADKPKGQSASRDASPRIAERGRERCSLCPRVSHWKRVYSRLFLHSSSFKANCSS